MIFEASIGFGGARAMIVCISSINKMTLPALGILYGGFYSSFKVPLFCARHMPERSRVTNLCP
jgi:hypothetical protein